MTKKEVDHYRPYFKAIREAKSDESAEISMAMLVREVERDARHRACEILSAAQNEISNMTYRTT